jgi:ubiquitin C-terminal hydrolase
MNTKISSKVEFRPVLDIKPFCKESPENPEYQYHLKGIVVHSGTSEFGHYYSIIKCQNENWLKFDDS